MSKNTWLFFMFWVFITAACSSGPRQIAENRTESPLLDERLAKISMTDLDGKPVRLTDFAGKPVFLNFWATWCGPCISEMKSIEAAARQFKDDIVFLAASNESPELIQAFLQKHPYNLRFVQLQVTYLDVYIVKLPTTMLIDAKGQLVAEEEGYRDWADPSNLEKLNALIKIR